jgi:hypothetical protein
LSNDYCFHGEIGKPGPNAFEARFSGADEEMAEELCEKCSGCRKLCIFQYFERFGEV